MNALTSSIQPPNHVTHSIPTDIYTATQSTHSAQAVKDGLNGLAVNNK